MVEQEKTNQGQVPRIVAEMRSVSQVARMTPQLKQSLREEEKSGGLDLVHTEGATKQTVAIKTRRYQGLGKRTFYEEVQDNVKQ